MRVDKAAPYHRGVTTLMAVGKDDPAGDTIVIDAGRAAKWAAIGGVLGLLTGKASTGAVRGAAASVLLNVLFRK